MFLNKKSYLYFHKTFGRSLWLFTILLKKTIPPISVENYYVYLIYKKIIYFIIYKFIFEDAINNNILNEIDCVFVTLCE